MCNNPNLELNFFESKNESVIKRLLNTTEFVDDKLENIEVAENLNFKTVHLTDPNKIKVELEKYSKLF